MSDGILNLKPEHRKAIWRTLRSLFYSLVVTLALCLVFFGVNPFQFWDTTAHVVIVLGMWIVVYHLYEVVKRQSA